MAEKTSNTPKGTTQNSSQKIVDEDLAARRNEIYNILGIDSRTEDDIRSPNHTPEIKNQFQGFDSDRSTGAIFDDYSKYPKDPNNYWFYFRIYTIVGIVFCAAVVLSLSFSGSWGKSGHHKMHYSTDTHYKPTVSEASGQLIYSLNPVTIEAPTNMPDKTQGVIYFEGKVNYRYGVKMVINTHTKEGSYYYTSKGSKNQLKLEITSYQKISDNQYRLEMEEYNKNGMYTGSWDGVVVNGSYTGEGEYNGKYMPFSLNQCKKSDTNF